MLANYKAVFFDVGGTLLRVHPSVGGVYALHAREFGFKGSAEELDRRFALEWKNMGGLEGLGNGKGPEVEKKFWHELVFRVFKPLGGLRDFDDYFEHIYDVFNHKESWRVFEDVLQSKLLERLKERGVVMGVISNWDSRLFKILENMGLAGYFNFILASTVVGSAKPDGLIFQEALRLSGVSASEACHIGDELDTDVFGARQAGIDAVLIDRKKKHGEEVSPKISSFMELV